MQLKADKIKVHKCFIEYSFEQVLLISTCFFVKKQYNLNILFKSPILYFLGNTSFSLVLLHVILLSVIAFN